MAIREYKCSSCGLMTEKLIPTQATPDPFIICSRCGEQAEFRLISRVALMTSTFQEQPIDVAIGRDADKRWADINERQAQRDKVRQQTGQMGLSMVGRNEFAPLSENEKVTRTDVNEALSETGYKSGADTSTDKNILGAN